MRNELRDLADTVNLKWAFQHCTVYFQEISAILYVIQLL